MQPGLAPGCNSSLNKHTKIPQLQQVRPRKKEKQPPNDAFPERTLRKTPTRPRTKQSQSHLTCPKVTNQTCAGLPWGAGKPGLAPVSPHLPPLLLASKKLRSLAGHRGVWHHPPRRDRAACRTRPSWVPVPAAHPNGARPEDPQQARDLSGGAAMTTNP